MAFKKNTSHSSASENPAIHFQTLTKRQYPDVMPHQKEILENYAAGLVDKPDVALQLPTGSGKTLVGLLIADWGRKKFCDRAVYLCPTRQLVKQTVIQAQSKYGIDVVDLSGSKKHFSPADKTAFLTGQKVAISTYSGLFNTHPFFEDPDLIIVDDAHAAENYIANMWSMEISAGTALHMALAKYLHDFIGSQSYARLTGDWVGSADANWIEKLPSPLVAEIEVELSQIVDAHVDDGDKELYFRWSLLRKHLDACHIYLGSREILIRPLIPPTDTHLPFTGPKQRIFMSATLGKGGDLERLTGRKSIKRLQAPSGFQSAGVGRRFFVFPSLSLMGDEADDLRTDLQKRSGRSVVLTPSQTQADTHTDQVTKRLKDFEVFDKDGIEDDKAPFVKTEKAVAVLANRFDGIDFPGDECRLLCIDGFPKAMNSQERFIMSKMGAAALFNERIQTRILQAVGRCTRALQDRSAVFVTGVELVDFLADDRKWKYFHPELQAELSFGVTQSTSVEVDDFRENFDMFMNNDSDWSEADNMIRDSIENFEQADFPAMDELEAVASHEVSYQHAIWNKNFEEALAEARSVLTNLKHPELRGYRALWHYLAGSAAFSLSQSDLDAQATTARKQFSAARGAAPSVSWLNALSRDVAANENETDANFSNETVKQVEALERLFASMGQVHNRKFEAKAASILKKLQDASTFETAQVELGEFLGFTCGHEESDAAPDPWWLGDNMALVFETHADGKEATIFGAVKARQAAGHPKWIHANVKGAESMTITPVLVTPCTKVHSGAHPHLSDVMYWNLSVFVAWASEVVSVLRRLKGKFPGEGDLVWRAEAAQTLADNYMTLETILSSLETAASAMHVDQ